MKNFFNKIWRFVGRAYQSPRIHRYALIALLIALIPIGYVAHQFITQHSEVSTQLTTPPDEVRGKIITLKTLKEEHFVDYHNMFSVTVRKNLEFPEFITLGYTIRYLQDQIQKANEGKMLMYGVFDNKDNKLIGAVEIRDKNDEDPGQLGIWLNEAYWGGGRIQEALALINKTYFNIKPNEKSYFAHVRLWNQRSYHALKKFGLKEIGYFYENGKAARHILEKSRD